MSHLLTHIGGSGSILPHTFVWSKWAPVARRRRPPTGPRKKRTKADDHTKTARRVTLQGGEMDGHQIWLALPLPPNIKMNMGRDSYFKREDDPGIFEYDPDREYVSWRSI